MGTGVSRWLASRIWECRIADCFDQAVWSRYRLGVAETEMPGLGVISNTTNRTVHGEIVKAGYAKYDYRYPKVLPTVKV